MALPSIRGHGIWWRRAAIALSLAVTVRDQWPWNYLGSSASRTPLTQLRAVSRQQPFQTLTRPVFDGLEDLEEEEEEELEDRSTVPKERSMVSRPIGFGLQILEDLYSKHRGSKDPPEIDDEELEDLHAMLKEELPRCPSISSMAFAAKVLEDLELEDDDVFEVIATEVKARADELEPQETLDIVLSFGAIYFNDDELLAALVGAIRRQLQFFTNAEIVRLANAMSRLGALDDSKHVGMFFEMRSRVNMPLIDKAIRERLGAEAAYTEPSEEAKKLVSKMKLPENSKMKEKFKTKGPKELTMMKYRAEKEAARREEIDPELLKEGPAVKDLFGEN